jgi:tripartite-type tricarboxylate transporter receptor subunit TctC
MMRENWKTTGMVFLFGLVLVLMPVLSHAQEYPSKPINVLIPTTPGNGQDVITRALLEDAKKLINQPLIPVNKPGGGGTIALVALAKEKPDGYTIGMTSTLPLIIIPQLRKMLYSMDDFVPILIFSEPSAAIAVRADSPWKTLKDLVEYARKNPRKIRCAVGSGTGNVKEIAMRVIAQKEQVDWIYVNYGEGDSPGLTDLLGGHIEVLSAGPVWVPHVQAGKLRLLASYMRKKLSTFPDVPTLQDLGYGWCLDLPMAFVAPKGTPLPIIKKLDSVFRKAAEEPGFKQTLKNLNYETSYYNSEETRKLYEENLKVWADAIKRFNIPKE